MKQRSMASWTSVCGKACSTTVCWSIAVLVGGLFSGQVAVAANIYRDTVLADNPVSYWRFEEVTGTQALDLQGNNNGTFVNAPTLERPGAIKSDPGGRALGLNLDGGETDEYMIVNPVGAFPSTAVTVEMWVRMDGTTVWQTAFSYAAQASPLDNELLLLFSEMTNGNALAWVANASYSSGVSLVDGQWHYVALTWESSSGALGLYVDGALAATATVAAGSSITPGGSLVVGQEQDAVGGGFDATQIFRGDIDELALYDKVLTPDRIAAHYAAAQVQVPEPSWLAVLAIGGVLIARCRRS